MNIKNILVLRFTVIVASILFIFSLFIYQFSGNYREKIFKERLLNRIYFKTGYLLEQKLIDSASLYNFYKLKMYTIPQEKLIIFKNNILFFANENLDEHEKIIYKKLKHENKSVSFNKNQRDYIAFNLKTKYGIYQVIASAKDEIGFQEMESLRNLLILLYLIGMLITAIAATYFASNALKPIKQIIDQVGKITATNLHNRVKVANPNDEIGVLAEKFNKMLERLNESFELQRIFVANASHEFRTPLTAIKGEIEVLLMQNRTEKEYKKTLLSINEEVDRQIALLNALRELAHATTDKNKIQNMPLPVAELLADARADLIKSVSKYNVQLYFKNFPENEQMLNTFGNYSLLKSCMINLMDNACKFSLNNKVVVDVFYNNHNIEINFSDKGVGISQEDLNNIFEPFYRANNTRHVEGFGIGMSLVKKVLALHNAEIFINSTPLERTTLDVILKNMV